MTAFDAYVMYLALKAHFNQDSYDFFKYNGKVRANAKWFDNRKDHHHFRKIADHRDPRGLIVANMVADPSSWSGDISKKKGEDRYLKQQGRIARLPYDFQQFIQQYCNTAEQARQLFESQDDRPPLLIQLFYKRKLDIELLLILIEIFRARNKLAKQLPEDLAWQQVEFCVRKYRRFIDVDVGELKQTLKAHIARNRQNDNVHNRIGCSSNIDADRSRSGECAEADQRYQEKYLSDAPG